MWGVGKVHLFIYRDHLFMKPFWYANKRSHALRHDSISVMQHQQCWQLKPETENTMVSFPWYVGAAVVFIFVMQKQKNYMDLFPMYVRLWWYFVMWKQRIFKGLFPLVCCGSGGVLLCGNRESIKVYFPMYVRQWWCWILLWLGGAARATVTHKSYDLCS